MTRAYYNHVRSRSPPPPPAPQTSDSAPVYTPLIGRDTPVYTPLIGRLTGNAGDGPPRRLPTAAVGVLSASHTDFSGDVLRVDASGAGAARAGAVLIRASSAGQDVFEVAVSALLRRFVPPGCVEYHTA